MFHSNFRNKIEQLLSFETGASDLFDARTGEQITKLMRVDPGVVDAFGGSVAIDGRFALDLRSSQLHVEEAAFGFWDNSGVRIMAGRLKSVRPLITFIWIGHLPSSLDQLADRAGRQGMLSDPGQVHARNNYWNAAPPVVSLA